MYRAMLTVTKGVGPFRYRFAISPAITQGAEYVHTD